MAVVAQAEALEAAAKVAEAQAEALEVAAKAAVVLEEVLEAAAKAAVVQVVAALAVEAQAAQSNATTTVHTMKQRSAVPAMRAISATTVKSNRISVALTVIITSRQKCVNARTATWARGVQRLQVLAAIPSLFVMRRRIRSCRGALAIARRAMSGTTARANPSLNIARIETAFHA